MSAREHVVCRACWTKQRGAVEPVKMRDAPTARCCYCGAETAEGIYLRDPKLVGCSHD